MSFATVQRMRVNIASGMKKEETVKNQHEDLMQEAGQEVVEANLCACITERDPQWPV